MLRSTHDAIVKDIWTKHWEWHSQHKDYLAKDWAVKRKELRGAHKCIARLQRKIKRLTKEAERASVELWEGQDGRFWKHDGSFVAANSQAWNMPLGTYVHTGETR
jgi:hypothetical protein